MLAKMLAGIEAGRLLVWRAGFLRTTGSATPGRRRSAKWHATDHAVQSALDAIQIHGANGYSNEFPVERYLRNARRRSSTRRHSSTRSSRPTTPLATARTVRSAASRSRPRARAAAGVGRGCHRAG